MNEAIADEVHAGARAAWAQFLEVMEPIRPGLANYCRRLTGDVWDAEDLAHDAMLRAFALMGSMFYKIENPRAYVLRIATNLWTDAQRRRILEHALTRDGALASRSSAGPAQEDAASVRNAGSALLQYLAPQERAAVLLRDVFDMSAEETAGILGTTPGAVKAALHRGRERLNETIHASERPLPSKAVLDRFVDRFNARDLPGLVALMLDTASIEMSGVNNEFGREGYTRDQGWFFHTVIGFPGDFTKPKTRWERREFRGEPLIVQLTTMKGADILTSVLRLDTEGEKVARVRCYTFCPDAVREVGDELGVRSGMTAYSFQPFRKAWQSVDPAD